MGMSWTEIGLILIIGVVLFGRDNRLPEMARSLGEAIGEFKRAMSPSEPPKNPTNGPSDSSENQTDQDNQNRSESDEHSPSGPPA